MPPEPNPTDSTPLAAHRPRLSVAMIVRDEADTIAWALDSVRAIADEIVVVDTGSTDETVSIAESAGAKVHHWPWSDDFAAARNAAIAHCSGDWILSLDADEALDEASAPTLRQIIEQAGEDLVGYQVRLTNWRDRDGHEASEHVALRLFPRHPALRFQGRIHETLQADAGTHLERHFAPEVVLHHFGYQRDERRFPAKLARNLALLERSVAENPDDTYFRYHWGVALQIAGHLDDALSRYREVIDRCAQTSREPEYLPYAHIYGIAACNALGRFPDALTWAAAGAEVCCDEPDYWLNLGIARSELGQFHAAIEAYQHCLRLGDGPHPVRIMDRGATSWKPLIGIGAAYQALGDVDKTEDYLRRALTLHPGHIGSLQTLIQLALDRQDYLRAELLMRQLVNACQGEARLHVLHELSRFLLSQRRFQSLIDLLPRVIAEPPSKVRHYHLAAITGMLQEAGYDRVVRSFLHQHRLMPDVAEILTAHYVADGDFAALQAFCDELIAAGIGLAFAHTQRGMVKLRQGDEAGGLADLRHAAELAPNDPAIWCHLGMTHLKDGQLEAAESDFQRATNAQDGYLPARLGLIGLSLARGDVETASRALDDVLTGCPVELVRLHAAAVAEVQRQCERLFDACFAGGSTLDPMALSRMIDRLSATLQGIGRET